MALDAIFLLKKTRKLGEQAFLNYQFPAKKSSRNCTVGAATSLKIWNSFMKTGGF